MEKINTVYCIDLDSRRPQVLEFSGEELRFDLDFFEAETPQELETYDRRVFNTEAEATEFLELFNRKLKTLSNSDICLSRDFPAMLYKRRYMILSLLGLKLQTYRDYLKPWKKGDYINLHDQTFFLTVRLTRDVYFDEEHELYCYEFEIPKKGV